MSKPLAQIPVHRENGPSETFGSETLVLVLPTALKSVLPVVRVPPRSPHIPETPRFSVMQQVWVWLESLISSSGYRKKRAGHYVEQPLVTTPVVRLGRVATGTPVYVKADPKRFQETVFYKKHWHAIFTFHRWEPDRGTSFETLCEEDFKGDSAAVRIPVDYAQFEPRMGDLLENGGVTCPRCLAIEWIPFVVGVYEPAHKAKKLAQKVKAEKRFRANIPTRFDRIYEDETPEPLPVLELDTEPDLEEPLGREPKLRSRVGQAKRFRAIQAKR